MQANGNGTQKFIQVQRPNFAFTNVLGNFFSPPPDSDRSVIDIKWASIVSEINKRWKKGKNSHVPNKVDHIILSTLFLTTTEACVCLKVDKKVIV